MIIKSEQLTDINGGFPPFMSVINTDFLFTRGASDGVYFQEIDNEKTLFFSIRGVTATICRLSKKADTEELSSFLELQGIKNVLSDFFFEEICFEERAVLRITPEQDELYDTIPITPLSKIGDYKSVFYLLFPDGSFDVWYPLFCSKVNKGASCGAYIMNVGIPVSCAVAPYIFGDSAVIAGVLTKADLRKKGYATRCVKALLSELHSKNIKNVYLWCEDKNIKLYENIGFSQYGKIYIKKEE